MAIFFEIDSSKFGFEIGPMQSHLRRIVREATEDVAKFAANRAEELAPVGKTSVLKNSIYSTRASKDIAATFEAVAGVRAPYADWVNRGTGLHGPFHTVITPRRAKRMKVPLTDVPFFKGPKRDGFAFLKKSMGQRGSHFQDKAVELTEDWIPSRLRQLEAEWAAFRIASRTRMQTKGITF